MADALIPGATYNENQSGAPLEAQHVGTLTGIAAQAGQAMHATLGSSLETQAIGKLQGGGAVPYDQVKAIFDDQKLDASVFPKGQPVERGEAIAVMGQQLAIQKDRDLAQRAGTDQGVTGFVAGLAGGFTDPALLATGIVAGPLLGAARAGLAATGVTAAKGVIQTGAGLATRVGVGAAEGAGGVAAYEKAEQQVGTAQGDRDITTGQIVHDAAWGGLAGGVLRGAFGTRPTTVSLEPLKQMIVGAENSAGFARTHGNFNPSDVVSKKGAVGLYQITPDTAKRFGFSGDAAMLKNPAYNEEVANANMEYLYKRYGNDPEAIAIAWNGGPGMADKFIKFGRRTLMLPKETQDYLARIKAQNIAPPTTPEPLAAQPTPTAFIEPQEGERMSPAQPRLVPSRQMPDGTTFPGTPGASHFSTFTPEQFEEVEKEGGTTSSAGGPGIEPTMAKFGKMGYQEIKGDGSYGKFMDREEAQKFIGGEIRPGGLETTHYNKIVGPDPTEAAVAKTAIAQAEQGSEINVEPVIKAMRDEASGAKADPNELAKAIPQHGSELTTAPIRDKLLAINRQVENAKPAHVLPTTGREPHPDVAEIQRLAKEATEEAANLHAGMTGEAAGVEGNKFEAYMKAEDEKFKESEGAEAQPEFQKALEAAVQCGIKNGAE